MRMMQTAPPQRPTAATFRGSDFEGIESGEEEERGRRGERQSRTRRRRTEGWWRRSMHEADLCPVT